MKGVATMRNKDRRLLIRQVEDWLSNVLDNYESADLEEVADIIRKTVEDALDFEIPERIDDLKEEEK